MGAALRVLAITTFNADGLEKYGRRMVASVLEKWPESVDFRVYSDGWNEKLGRVEVVDLNSASKWLLGFKSRNAHRTFKDFRWDAVRFAHKVAAVCHAARESVDYVIWMDGDTVTHSDFSETDLRKLLPAPGAWISWLHRKKQYPECGFFIIHCRHDRHPWMISDLERMYALDDLYALDQFHDSFVLEHVVKRAAVPWTSLSGPGDATGHPLANGPLSMWFDHMKGPRKEIGRSRRSDRIMGQPHAYWSSL